MNNQQRIQIFESVRGVPYRIPLDAGEDSFSCLGKNKRLMKELQQLGLDVRWRVGTFRWSDLGLPKEIQKVPHDDDATHAYLEVNIRGEWKAIDATWDKVLSAVFPVAEWNGIDSTVVGVPLREIYSPEESASIMKPLDDLIEYEKAFVEDFKVNGEFYKAFNQWSREIREDKEA